MFQDPEGNSSVNLQAYLQTLSDEDMEYFVNYSLNETRVNNDPCTSGVPSDSSGRESNICELFQLDIVSFSVSTYQYVKNLLFIHGL